MKRYLVAVCLLCGVMLPVFAGSGSWTTKNVTPGITNADGGSYGGVAINLASDDWLVSSFEMNPEKNYTLGNLSVTIRGRENSGNNTYSWTAGIRLLVRDYTTNPGGTVYKAISTSSTVGDDKRVTWSGFVDANGVPVAFDVSHKYLFYFVTAPTVLTATTVHSGQFTNQQLAAYTNGNVGTAQTGTGLVNGSTTDIASPGYKPYLVVSGDLTAVENGEDKGVLNVYLLTGQSNSLGAVKGSPLSSEKLASHRTSTDDVIYWHENFLKDGAVYDGASTSWEPVAPAVPVYNDNPCMGPEYGFAWMLSQKGWIADKPLGIIKASLDGGGNGYWEEGGNGWAKINAAAGRAVMCAIRDGYSSVNFLGVIYLQGESNTAAEAQTADARLTALPDRFKTALGALSDRITFSDDFHVAVGEPANWTLDGSARESKDTVTRDNLYAAATAVSDGKDKPFGTWIPTRDLAKITSGDNMKVHYDGQSQLTIGARYAYAEAMRVGYRVTEAVRSPDYRATLDSAAAYYAGTVPVGETVRWDVSSAALSTVGADGVALHGLAFDADGGNYLQTGATLIDGTGTLSVGAGGVTAAKNVTFTAPVSVAADQIWTVASGATVRFASVSLASGAALALSVAEGAMLELPVVGDLVLRSADLAGTLHLVLPSEGAVGTISVAEGTLDPSKITTNRADVRFELSADGRSFVPVLPRKGEYTWMPIGDSITEGESSFETVGGYRKPMWEYFTADGFDVRSVGYRNGHCGTVEPESADKWAWHNGMYGGGIVPVGTEAFTHGMQHYSIETELEICGYPDVITILIGINDLSFNVSGTSVDENVGAVWRNLATYVAKTAALRPESAVVVSTLLPSNSNSTKTLWGPFNTRMRQAKANNETPFNIPNVYLADMAKDAFNDTYTAGNYKSDALHPNRTGGLLLGRAFATRVEEILLERRTIPARIVSVHNEGGQTPKIHIRFSKPLASFAADGVTLSDGTTMFAVTDCAIDAVDKCLVVGSVADDAAFAVKADWTLAVDGAACDLDGNAVAFAGGFASCDIAASGVAAHVPDEFTAGFERYKIYNLPENANSMEIAADTVRESVVAGDKLITDVAFYLELKRPGKSAQFVWCAMDAAAFARNPAKMGVPTAASGTIQNFNVANLNVYGNRGNFTKQVKGGRGIIEFSPYQYAQTDKAAGSAEIRSNAFGWNDTLENNQNGYGCMQVFYVANETNPDPLNPFAETVFAYNAFAVGNGDDLGIGTMVTHRSNADSLTPAYDWTYIGSGGFTKTLATTAYETRLLEVWVKARDVVRAVIQTVDGDGAAAAYVVNGIPYSSQAEVLRDFDLDVLEISDQAQPRVLTEDLTAFTNVKIGANVTVPRASLKAGVVLSGSGAVDYGAPATPVPFVFGDDWTGIVKLSGWSNNSTALDVSPYGTAASKIELAGITGLLSQQSGGAALDRNLTLANDGGFALKVQNGWSSGTLTVTGSLSGDGALQLDKNGIGNIVTQYFTFTGDLSDFTGAFQTINGAQGGNLTFGAGTEGEGSRTLGSFGIDWAKWTGNGNDRGYVIFNYGAAEVTYGGVISTAVLKKQGTGSLTLTGANTYGGGTTVEAGTLVAGHASALGTGSVTVARGATLEIAEGVSATVGADATLTGAVVIDAGATLQTGGTVAFQNVAIDNADGAVGLFKVPAGTTATVSGDSAIRTAIAVEGTLNLSDTIDLTKTIAVTGGTVNIAAGTVIDLTGYDDQEPDNIDRVYDLVSVTAGGTVTGFDGLSKSSFKFEGDLLSQRKTVYVRDTTNNGKLLTFAQAHAIPGFAWDGSIVVSGAVADLTWNGGDGEWGAAGAWTNEEGHSDSFVDADNVTFDSANATVTLGADVSAKQMTVTADMTLDLAGYAFNAFSITVARGVTLTLTNSAAGTAKLVGDITLCGDGTFVIPQTGIELPGATQENAGSLVISEEATLDYGTLTGSGVTFPASLAGTGTIKMTIKAENTSKAIRLANTDFEGNVYLAGSDSSTTSIDLSVLGTLHSDGINATVLGSKATLILDKSVAIAAGTATIAAPIVVKGSNVFFWPNSAATITFSGDVTLEKGSKLTQGNGAVKFAGNVTVNGSTINGTLAFVSGATLDVAVDAADEANGLLLAGSFTLEDGVTVKHKGRVVAVEARAGGIYLVGTILAPETDTEHKVAEDTAFVVEGVMAADAATAAEKVVVKAPDGLTAAEAAAYSACFAKTAAQTDTAWTVTVALDGAAVVPAITAGAAAGDTPLLADVLPAIAAADAEAEMSVAVGNVKPGLYYTLEAGRDITALAPRCCCRAPSGASVLALPVPSDVKGAPSGFFRVRVTPWAVDAR